MPLANVSYTYALSGLAARAQEALQLGPGFDIHRAQHVCAYIDAVDELFEEMVPEIYFPGVEKLVGFLAVSRDDLDIAVLCGGSEAASTLRALYLLEQAAQGQQLKLVA